MSEMLDALNQVMREFTRLENGNTETLRALDSVKVENEKLKESVSLLSESDSKKTETINHLMKVKDDMFLQVKELERENIKLNNEGQAQELKMLNLEKMNQNLQAELVEVKEGIILSKENRKNRESTLSEEDVGFIKQARADGLTLRKIGEMIDKSHTTVANVLKAESVKTESDFTDTSSNRSSAFSKKNDDELKKESNYFDSDDLM